jgi:hypothetical protein
MYPTDGADVPTLTKNADMATYLAKEDGKNGFRFFAKEVKIQSIERLKLETGLRHALEREEFLLHYQPKVEPRHSAGDRRFRNRLFVDVVDEAVPDRYHQDRSFLCSRSEGLRRSGHRTSDHQHGQGAGK